MQKNKHYGLLIVALVITILAVGANSKVVFADPCIVQLSYPIMPATLNYASNIQVIVPVSATCTAIGNTITAVGDAYDTSLNTDLGTIDTVLTPVSTGSFSGQLIFNVAQTSLGHNVQIAVSIYSGQYGNYAPGQYGTLLTTATETVQVNPTTYTNGYYPVNYPNGYTPTVTPQPVYVQPQQPVIQPVIQQPVIQQPVIQQTYPTLPFYARQNIGAGFFGRQNTTWLIGLVVMIIVGFSVIVIIAVAVIATRNRQPQQVWIPPGTWAPQGTQGHR